MEVEALVAKEHVDGLGHVNFIAYQQLADDLLMIRWAALNGGAVQAQRGGREFVTAETHIRYMREMRLGDRYRLSLLFCERDDKRFVYLASFTVPDGVACVVETLVLSFDTVQRRVMPFSDSVLRSLAQVVADDAEHAATLASGKIYLRRGNLH